MADHYSVGKYHYQHLLMGVANSHEILQQKMNDLFHVFEFIRAYIDNLSISKKGYWTDNVQNL